MPRIFVPFNEEYHLFTASVLESTLLVVINIRRESRSWDVEPNDEADAAITDAGS